MVAEHLYVQIEQTRILIILLFTIIMLLQLYRVPWNIKNSLFKHFQAYSGTSSNIQAY